MNIGFFHPTNQLAVDVATLLIQFAKDGHKVVLITIASKGSLHQALTHKGVEFEFLGDNKKEEKIYKRLRKSKTLASICKKHKLDVMYNNLGECQLIALLASHFCNTKMIYYRHHSSEATQLYGMWKDKLLDRILNKFSKNILVPSKLVMHDVINEGANPSKIALIPYCYDFSLYPTVEEDKVNKIRSRFPNKNIILMISRFVPQKRYEVAIEVMSRLEKNGKGNIILLALGNGSLKKHFQEQVLENSLADVFFIEGFADNVFNYIAVCDLLIHPSGSEASCHVIKEAGIMKKTVICCENVGDFSDYIVNEENGYLVDKYKPSEDMYLKICQILASDIDKNKTIGENLQRTILEKFSGETVAEKHYFLLNRVLRTNI